MTLNRQLLLDLIEAFNDAHLPFRLLPTGAIAFPKGSKMPDLYYRGLNESPDEATLKCELGAFVQSLQSGDPKRQAYICEVCKGYIENTNLIASTWDRSKPNIRYWHKWCALPTAKKA